MAQPATTFEPTVGQSGKDVIWVPTGEPLIERMLDMAAVTPADFVIDLGSGDGRTVIAAAKRGANALGSSTIRTWSTCRSATPRAAGVAGQANFVKADLFESDFSQATVADDVSPAGDQPPASARILDMKPGTRVVSNTFTMGEWTADNTAESSGDCKSYCKAYFWIVPPRWTADGGPRRANSP
jgi:hypothetical protein